jgi:hypothetical protein
VADRDRETDARMTIRLDPATRRKVERLAAREGLSLNEAVNRLLQRAPDHDDHSPARPPYRLKPRTVGFGFDIARAKELAAAMADEQVLGKAKGGR